MTDPDERVEAAEVPEGAGGTSPWRVLGVVAMIGVALFWIWIFSGGPRKPNPDRIEDRAWVERAESTCAATMERVDDRGAPAGRQGQAARADAIDASTDDLRVMVDELGSPLPGSDGDREVVEPWLADWDSLLGDRSAYADAVRVDPDARFLITEKFNDPLDRVIEIFADVNDMPSCGPAGDVA